MAYLKDGRAILFTGTIKKLLDENPDFVMIRRGLIVRKSLVREIIVDDEWNRYLKIEGFDYVFKVARRLVKDAVGAIGVKERRG